MSTTKSVVVINHLPAGLDLQRDHVALPHSYGTAAYENREDILAIRRLLAENLDALDARIHFSQRMTGRRVFLKPNLVTVYHQMGLLREDYPETTDPRLLDAIVIYFKRFAGRISIVEGSGRGVPTRGSFRVAGLDRLARRHGVDLIPLEEQPMVRYLLPGAQVQKEIIVPELFEEVIRREAFFVSIPKLKTNLYTGVTLGFKNAMGILPYNLRQRHHHFQIDQKLVDILQLFQADLTIIDGLVGGEGNCPAPVDPVDSRVIISGNNSVETDRVATRMMGFDPESIRLMQAAKAAGFGDAQVEIVGEERVTPFRPAEPSLFALEDEFPRVRFLIGHSLPHAPKVRSLQECSPELARQMELTCRGGCLAMTRFAFDMFMYEGQRRDFSLVLLLGDGFDLQGERCYMDGQGHAISINEIAALPGKKMAVGSCARAAAGVVDRFIDGCIPYPNSAHAVLHHLSGTHCTVTSLKNRHLIPLLFDTLCMCERRKGHYRAGRRLDCSLPEGHAPTPEPFFVTEDQKQLRAIRWDLPPLSREEIRAACKAENRAVLATFSG